VTLEKAYLALLAAIFALGLGMAVWVEVGP
jgi:hypothetical protein